MGVLDQVLQEIQTHREEQTKRLEALEEKVKHIESVLDGVMAHTGVPKAPRKRKGTSLKGVCADQFRQWWEGIWKELHGVPYGWTTQRALQAAQVYAALLELAWNENQIIRFLRWWHGDLEKRPFGLRRFGYEIGGLLVAINDATVAYQQERGGQNILGDDPRGGYPVLVEEGEEP